LTDNVVFREVADIPELGYDYMEYSLTGGWFMNIDCYLSHGCGSEKALRENITQALAIEKVKANVNFNVVDDEKAIALGLSGSPSIFVDGREIQPQGTVGFA
jgi:hypothetical protein